MTRLRCVYEETVFVYEETAFMKRCVDEET